MFPDCKKDQLGKKFGRFFIRFYMVMMKLEPIDYPEADFSHWSEETDRKSVV